MQHLKQLQKRDKYSPVNMELTELIILTGFIVYILSFLVCAQKCHYLWSKEKKLKTEGD